MTYSMGSSPRMSCLYNMVRHSHDWIVLLNRWALHLRYVSRLLRLVSMYQKTFERMFMVFCRRLSGIRWHSHNMLTHMERRHLMSLHMALQDLTSMLRLEIGRLRQQHSRCMGMRRHHL